MTNGLGVVAVTGVVAGATLLSWLAGTSRHRRRRLTRAGRERAEHRQRELRAVADRVRLAERTRIAQDMHDVLGHDLSLLALRAGTLSLASGLDERHRRAAADIRNRAAAAVEHLGEVVGVLRDGAGAAPARPPGSGLAHLTAEASRSGLPVELRVDGAADGLSAQAEQALHRVVQEALTNIVKHAPGARATVHVTHTPTETTVLVANGPPSRPATALPPGGGRGLTGLGERVRAAGGTFQYGPCNPYGPYRPCSPYSPYSSYGSCGPHGRGFAVVARIPRRRAPAPPARVRQDRSVSVR
ncbi:histidine kinase [Streptomyces sp. NPDC052496]|uniref:sensor histidine kinase n=1 Tax=Streptomyces sp. NPDC052496 TaxID=3154951 RepID=UPI003436A7D8